MAATTEIKKIALVFSGGLSRGAAHIAFANELVKKIGLDRFCVITGASIGAINAYATSVGHTQDLVDIYGNIDCDNTKQFIKKVKNDFFGETFNSLEDEIKVPTYVTVTKLVGFDCGYYCLDHMPRKDLKACINSSMAFPIVNGPGKFAGRLVLDGGATDNIPVWPVTYFDPDMVIILHCYSRYYPPEFLFEHLRKDCIVVDVDVSLNFERRMTPFSFSKLDFDCMLKQGAIDGKEFAEKIFEDFNTENVRQRTYRYINEKMEVRRKKNWNGYLELVEMLNALYHIKEGRF